jgi:ribonucleoside-triphosphate reductase
MYLGEKANLQSGKNLMRKIITRTSIPYLDYTTTFSVCKREGRYLEGVAETCPICSSEVYVFSRVVGYYRSINKYNPGKIQEFVERKYISKQKIINANRFFEKDQITKPLIMY